MDFSFSGSCVYLCTWVTGWVGVNFAKLWCERIRFPCSLSLSTECNNLLQLSASVFTNADSLVQMLEMSTFCLSWIMEGEHWFARLQPISSQCMSGIHDGVSAVHCEAFGYSMEWNCWLMLYLCQRISVNWSGLLFIFALNDPNLQLLTSSVYSAGQLIL